MHHLPTLLANRPSDSERLTPIRTRIATTVGGGTIYRTAVGEQTSHLTLEMPGGREYFIDAECLRLPSTEPVGLDNEFTLADAAAIIADIESGALSGLLALAAECGLIPVLRCPWPIRRPESLAMAG